jgi:hypothetical protein
MRKGKILTFKQVKDLIGTNTMVHLLYYNPNKGNGEDCFNTVEDYYEECKVDGETWAIIDGVEVPLNGIDDEEINDVENCGWYLTIHECIL